MRLLIPLLLILSLRICSQAAEHTGKVILHFPDSSSSPFSTVLNLPKHTIKPTDTAGTVLYTRITNTTAHSISLRPLQTPFNAYDSATLLQGILGQLKPSYNADDIRVQLIKIVGQYIKSPYKQSFFPNFREGNADSVINREYSLIGSGLSMPSWHCDNFCKEAIYLLEATGLFTDNDFILQNCSIHTTMQVILPAGDSVFADMAVGTPVFMVANPAKQSGWASLSDILNNNGLINQQSQYYYVTLTGDSVNLSPWRSIDNYVQMFQLPWTLNLYHASAHVPDNFSGDFILAPGQHIEYRDTLGQIIDTTQNGYGALIEGGLVNATNYGVTGKIDNNEEDLDSALFFLYQPYAQILDIAACQATTLYNSGKILLYSNSSDWTPSYLPNQSVIYSTIPASTDTLFYGKQTSAPLLITASTCIIDGQQTESFNASFFANSLFSTAPDVDQGQFNYANGVGKFKRILPNTVVNQTLQYNCNVLNFYTGGPMFIATDTGLLVQASHDIDTNPIVLHPMLNLPVIPPTDYLPVNNITEPLSRHNRSSFSNNPDLISDVRNLSGGFNVWPNPVVGTLHVLLDNGTGNSIISVYDLSGKLVKQAAAKEGEDLIDLENISGGLYFVTIAYNFGETETRKIVIMPH